MTPKPSYRIMVENFQRALIDNPKDLEVRFLRLAGRTARVRIIGKELSARLRPALRHLEVESDHPDLRIDVLDQGKMSPHNRQLGGLVSFRLCEEFATQSLVQSKSVLSRKESHLMVTVQDRASLSAYETARPWHAPLAIWHLDQGTPLIHAGAVMGKNGGILIGGPAGSGKSHTCLQCAFAGAGYLGDDMIGLESVGETYRAHSLYGSTFLTPKDMSKFPDLLTEPSTSGEKSYAFVPTEKPSRAPIKSVVLPRIVPGLNKAKLRDAKPIEVLLGLGPSTIQVGSLSPGPLAFEMLTNLANTTPGYHLELGNQAPEALRDLLC